MNHDWDWLYNEYKELSLFRKGYDQVIHFLSKSIY